jgi:DNA-binding SARP family transcriptional activator
VEFRILGPFEVVSDDESVLDLGSNRERALLAFLVLHANEVLSSDRIVDEFWPSGAPPTAGKIVQLYVSHLRKALGDARGLLETRAPGYVLRISKGATDVERCERLVNEAAGRDAATRAQLLRVALAIWRDAPLSDLAYESFAAHEIARLEEWRLSIVEDRIAADLELGHAAGLVPELDALVRAHPLRERLRGQHMGALYRAGRQADALASYRDLRRILDEELGLEPGASLRELERAILRQDPTLDGTADGLEPDPSPATQHAILVASHDGDLAESLKVAEALASVGDRWELILARLVSPDELGTVTRELTGLRDDLVKRGHGARVAAFTSAEPGADLVRLAAGEPIDLIVATVRAKPVSETIAALLAGAPCDVALHVAGSGPSAGPVMVPFGAARHDWAALELGAWLARGIGSTLQLIGATSDDPDVRDASRLLADASLIVQRATGVVAEPLLSRPGLAVADVARSAGTLVIGLPESWRETGLGPVRTALAASPPACLLFVHRGVRPSGATPPAELSSYAWSVERSRTDLRGR